MEDMDYTDFEKILQKINDNMFYTMRSVLYSIKDTEEFRELSYLKEYCQYMNKLLLECIEEAYYEGAHYIVKLLEEELKAIALRRKKNH